MKLSYIVRRNYLEKKADYPNLGGYTSKLIIAPTVLATYRALFPGKASSSEAALMGAGIGTGVSAGRALGGILGTVAGSLLEQLRKDNVSNYEESKILENLGAGIGSLGGMWLGYNKAHDVLQKAAPEAYKKVFN